MIGAGTSMPCAAPRPNERTVPAVNTRTIAILALVLVVILILVLFVF